jgi:hypothetical protein
MSINSTKSTLTTYINIQAINTLKKKSNSQNDNKNLNWIVTENAREGKRDLLIGRLGFRGGESLRTDGDVAAITGTKRKGVLGGCRYSTQQGLRINYGSVKVFHAFRFVGPFGSLILWLRVFYFEIWYVYKAKWLFLFPWLWYIEYNKI